MKKIFAALCTLMLIPMLALANSDMVSVSELRQQVEAMERWTQTYEAHGRTIEVDIPIYIPNEKELAVYDCSAYTEYIKNPNSDDKNNVYSYNENLRELTKENDGTSEADIEVYGKGTELRIMLNNPEDLLGKNKNDNIKIKKYGFYQYQVDDKVTYAENNEMSLEEAEKYLEVQRVASSADKTFSYIPDCSDLDIPEDADYVYICENNTIYGTKFKKLPKTKGKTLVADVSSCFLSEPVDVTKYGVIYGGVQKNIGPAGVVIVIAREDLITDDVLPGTPTMLKWKTQADKAWVRGIV